MKIIISVVLIFITGSGFGQLITIENNNNRGVHKFVPQQEQVIKTGVDSTKTGQTSVKHVIRGKVMVDNEKGVAEEEEKEKGKGKKKTKVVTQ